MDRRNEVRSSYRSAEREMFNHDIPKFGRREKTNNNFGKRYSMPETFVSQKTWDGMKRISRERGENIYTVCRQAFEEFVRNHVTEHAHGADVFIPVESN